MDDKKTIVLTGFMGSGKSAVGKILARRLGMAFFDLDEEIEKGENESITTIFHTRGEARFRQLESLYLKRLLTRSPLVLALGGGALQQNEVVQTIRKKGIMVYLNVPVEVLFQRLKKDKKRPMLRDEKGKLLDDPQLRERMHSLLTHRESLYQQADVTVSVQPGWSKTKTTNEVIKILSQYAPATLTDHH